MKELNWRNIQGWLTEKEGQYLSEIAKDKIVLEVGSFKGKSTMALASTAKIVVSIDDFSGGENFKTYNLTHLKEDFIKNIKQQKNIINLNIRSEQLIPYWNTFIDVLFIDSDHNPQQLSKEINGFANWLVEDGFLALHDYYLGFGETKKSTSITNYIDEVVRKDKKFEFNKIIDSMICFKRKKR